MSEEKKLDTMEIMEEALENINGGVAVDDLASVVEGAEESNAQKKGVTKFNIKSNIATGEKIASVPKTSLTGTKSTGKKLPKIVFADKGRKI